ncbi:MAG: aromatic ring-hydroxylating dioxygenase subunit alpha [Acidobacteriota bacterium]
MYRNSRPELPANARTLPSGYYTRLDVFAEEMEKIHFRTWLYAGRIEQVERSGDYFLVELGGESVIVLRDGQGALRAFYNVCRHRGTRICEDATGRFPGKIQCPYHAWTYSYDGALVQAPLMGKTRGFCTEDHPLIALAVDAWDGHLFIHFGEEPPPLAQQLDDLPTKFRPWRMEELKLADTRTYSVRANWKLVIQNYSECIHCPLLHPQLQELSHYMSGANDPPHPSYLGGRMDLREGVETLAQSADGRWAPLPGLGEVERRGVYYYAVLPNLLLNLHPNYMLTFALWPRAHNRTEIVCRWYFHPHEMERPGFDPSSAVDFWDLTNRQDWKVSELAQQGISSRAYRSGPYSNREELLYAFDRYVVERIGDSI